VCSLKLFEGAHDLQESSEESKELYPFIFIDLRFIFHIIVAISSQSRSLFHAQARNTHAVLNWNISTVDRFHLHLNQNGKIKSFLSESK